MRARHLLILMVLMLLRPALPLQAQSSDSLRLSTLEISLWPEFDRSEVLVILQGRLAESVPLPTQLTLTMPEEAGEPHAVAAVDEEGSRWTAEYETQLLDDAIEVTYTSLEHRAFQFEYYWNLLQIEGQQRQFTFTYQLAVSVDDLALVFQQPSGATSVTLSPPATEVSPGFAGLSYHRRSLGAVEAGQKIEWRVSYIKSDSSLSADMLPANEAEPAASSGVFSDTVSSVGVAVGVVLALALGGLWFANSRRRPQVRRRRSHPRGAKPLKQKGRKDRKGTRPQSKSIPPKQARPARRAQMAQPAQRAEQAASQAVAQPPGGFCHQCGTALKQGALFCPQCGTRRKGT
jgi:hypothetical protein